MKHLSYDVNDIAESLHMSTSVHELKQMTQQKFLNVRNQGFIQGCEQENLVIRVVAVFDLTQELTNNIQHRNPPKYEHVVNLPVRLIYIEKKYNFGNGKPNRMENVKNRNNGRKQ